MRRTVASAMIGSTPLERSVSATSSISRARNDNEQKVQQGVAERLFAGNFLKDIQQLSFQEKLQRFELHLHAYSQLQWAGPTKRHTMECVRQR